jgi:large subunit ribosomal protein L2
MNPVDHPHGGGQGKTKGGRPSVTPFSWPTKGQPTRNPRIKNPLILTTRKKKIKQ